MVVKIWQKSKKKEREMRKKTRERWKKVRELWGNFSKKIKAFLIRIKARKKWKKVRQTWENVRWTWKNLPKLCKAFVIVVALVLAVIFLTDEYGTPWFMWNWTYGLIDGRYRAAECDCFVDELSYNHAMMYFGLRSNIVGLRRGENFGWIRAHDGDEITISQRCISLSGSDYFWEYLQVSVNSELVRHRWPRAESFFAPILPFGHERRFFTESFALRRGRNEIVVTSVIGNVCVSKTFYIIRE